MRDAKAYIGTSGWNYQHWKGQFYPPEIKQAEWLGYFAKRFDTVEINNSFYRIPTREMFEEWQEDTPARFRFAVKLWRGITHYRKLLNCREYLGNFLQVAETLEARQRGPLLVQLPPNQGKDTGRLKSFFADLKSAMRARWRIAVEFRNDEWLCTEVYRLIDRERVAICLHDMAGRAPANEPNDASFVYVRRHGPSDQRYRGRYTPGQIEADARRIRGWLGQGKTVFVYYNNDLGGHAVRNANQLLDALSG